MDVRAEYFNWIYQLVCDDTVHTKLLSQLFDTPFAYILEMDGNRAADGENLRYRFGREVGYHDSVIASELDNCPCSVLEMMVALAVRMEEHIMEDEELGDRTGQWFWNMIVSLGLGSMTDVRYDSDRVEDILQRFMDRRFKRDGSGSLFTIEGTRQDMRNVEIWYQMCMYLDTIL